MLTCGCVRRILRQPSSFILTIEDGTGSIEARKWFDASSSSGFLSSNNEYAADNGDTQESDPSAFPDDPNVAVLSSVK